MPDHKTPGCECGYEVTAVDEAGSVEEIRSHAQKAHGVAFSVEEALLVLLRSEFDVSPGDIQPVAGQEEEEQ